MDLTFLGVFPFRLSNFEVFLPLWPPTRVYPIFDEAEVRKQLPLYLRQETQFPSWEMTT